MLRDPSVEPHHCLLVFRGEKVIYLAPNQANLAQTDLRSLSGPELGPGDPLRIGGLQFSLAHSSLTVAVPEPHREGFDGRSGRGSEGRRRITALLLRALPGICPGRGGQAGGVGGPCQTQPVSQVQRPSRTRT